MKQGLLVELTPAQLLLPDGDGMPLLLTAGLLASVPSGTPGPTRAERAHTQGSTQIGGTRGAGEIAIGLVAEQGAITERVSCSRAAASPGRHGQSSVPETMVVSQRR